MIRMRISHPALNGRFESSKRKFPAIMLEINVCKPVVTNDWPAVPFAKFLVFTDGIETGRKNTTLASFHRLRLAKHRKLHAETGRCIPA